MIRTLLALVVAVGVLLHLVDTGTATPLPLIFKRAITFLFADAAGTQPLGTGLAIRDASDPTTKYGYLVTARHVIQERDIVVRRE